MLMERVFIDHSANIHTNIEYVAWQHTKNAQYNSIPSDILANIILCNIDHWQSSE